MVWEGDRLFCFLQQSKLETCGSPDKLSRVGELAGLITGRAKTGQLDRTALDHTENWIGQSRIVLVCVCVYVHARVLVFVWNGVCGQLSIFSLSVCATPGCPLPRPPVDMYTQKNTLTDSHTHVHAVQAWPEGSLKCFQLYWTAEG